MTAGGLPNMATRRRRPSQRRLLDCQLALRTNTQTIK